MPQQSDDYFLCPHCGEPVKNGAVFCRACGASEDSGWGNEDEEDWEDDDDFDYGEFVAREFPDQVDEGQREWRSGDWKRMGFALVILLLIISFVLLSVVL